MTENNQDSDGADSDDNKVPPLPDLSQELKGLTGSGGPQPRDK